MSAAGIHEDRYWVQERDGIASALKTDAEPPQNRACTPDHGTTRPVVRYTSALPGNPPTPERRPP